MRWHAPASIRLAGWHGCSIVPALPLLFTSPTPLGVPLFVLLLLLLGPVLNGNVFKHFSFGLDGSHN